jgi:hypothetical protein
MKYGESIGFVTEKVEKKLAYFQVLGLLWQKILI